MKPFVNKSLFVVSLILIGTVFFSACKKDKNDPETASVPLLASNSRFDNKGVLYYSETYQYDKQNRLIKMTFHDGYFFTYEYSGSTIIQRGVDGVILDGTIVLQLNNKGLCTYYSSGDTYNAKFEYYDDGYGKSNVYENPINIKTSTFANYEGNYTSSTYEEKSKTTNSAITKQNAHFKSAFVASNSIMRFAPVNRLKSTAADYSSKTECLFYTDKLSTSGNANRGISYYGQANKNPIKTEFITYTDGVTGAKSYDVFNDTYEYDAKNRITKQLIDNGYYFVYTYVD